MSEYLGNRPNCYVGMTFAKTRQDEVSSLSHSRSELFDAANKKGVFFTGGGSIFVVY